MRKLFAVPFTVIVTVIGGWALRAGRIILGGNGGSRRNLVATLSALLLIAGAAQAQQPEKAPGPAIEDGSTVRIEYTLKDDSGQVLDTNKGREPLTYKQGGQQILPGFENALRGMRAGQEKKVIIKSEEGYGPLDPKAQIEVPKEAIPQGAKVGTRLQGRNPTGQPQVVRVKEIREKTVVLDTNHPLAGTTLHFDIKIVAVQPSTTQGARPTQATAHPGCAGLRDLQLAECERNALAPPGPDAADPKSCARYAGVQFRECMERVRQSIPRPPAAPRIAGRDMYPECPTPWGGTKDDWLLHSKCVDAARQERARQEEEERRRRDAEAERKRQADLEERRVRALEGAAQAERDKAQAIRDAARESNRPRTCTTTRNRVYPYEITTVCE